MNFFISSTFKDFRVERETLRYELLPKFRDEAFSYGESVSITDLQFGIDNFGLDEKASTQLVLSVCLDAVDSCRPCFIALIGQRYGYECQDKTWLPEKFAEALPNPLKSITELETIYALSNKDCDAVICIRTIDNLPDDQRKNYIDDNPALDDLKKWLNENHKDKILEYCATWQGDKLGNFRTLDGRDFFTVLQERLEALCRPRWEATKNMPWQERELQFTWRFVEERATSFFGRTNLLKDLSERLIQTNCLHVIGAGGSGKTSLLCKLATDLKTQGKFVVCLFGDSRQNSARAWLEQMIFALEKHLNESHEISEVNRLEVFDFGKRKYRLEKLCAQTNEQIFFIFDACDQLDDDANRNALTFLPHTTKNVHSLLSYTDDFKPQKHIGDYVQSLPLLPTKDIAGVLKEILQNRYKRSLFKKTEEAVLRKKSAAQNFLFLHMTTQLLDMISSRELIAIEDNPPDIVTTTVTLIDGLPDSPKDAAWHILRIAAIKICRNPQAVTGALDALRLLGLSRSGLRLSDLEVMLGFETAFDYVRLRRYFSDFFIHRSSNDADDFSHRIIKKAIVEQITEPIRLEEQLANHFEKLPANDPLRKMDGFYYAQQRRKIGFASKLLEEATEDFPMLQQIGRVMMSDGGNFGCTVLKNWRGNVIKLFQNLLMTMTESTKDCDVLLKLIDAAKSHQTEINLQALEILNAMVKVNFDQSQSEIKNLKDALDEAETTAEGNAAFYADKDFCELMYSASVVLLRFDSLELDMEQIIRGYGDTAYRWMSRAINSEPEKKIFTEYFKTLFPEGTLETPRSLHNFLQRQLSKYPTEIAYLHAAIVNCLTMTADCDDPAEAIALCEEAIGYAKTIATMVPSATDGLKLEGMATLHLSKCEFAKILFDLEQDETADVSALIQSTRRHANAGLQLLDRYCEQIPVPMVQEIFNDTSEEVWMREQVLQAIDQCLR